MIPTKLAKNATLMVATLMIAFPLIGLAAAQDPAEEVLCPIFIPEAPVKYCIEIAGNGCVIVHVRTAVGTDVNERTCPP